MQVLIKDEAALHEKVYGIYDTLMGLFITAADAQQSPLWISDRRAEEILYGAALHQD